MVVNSEQRMVLKFTFLECMGREYKAESKA